MSQTNLNAQQRAQLFAMSTRQNKHMLAQQTAVTTPATLNFNFPKARLLSSVLVRVKGTVNLKSDSVESVMLDNDMFRVYKSIRRISIDLNNGFAPFVISGTEALMYNMIDLHPELHMGVKTNGAYVKHNTYFTAEPEGHDNEFDFTICLPCTTNPRDPIGLILLQNDQTNVNCTIDFGTGAEMFADVEKITGAELKNVTVKMSLETFSIPANANAYPDLSVLKLVNGRKDSMPSSGQQMIKLATGTIYRKLIFRILDENDMPVDDSFINSNIELVFNTADINYSIDPEMLRIMNQKELGFMLPKGMFVFDFSNSGGFPNLGGTRDFIDSANLTDFVLRFSTTAKGKVEIVTETLARLG